MRQWPVPQIYMDGQGSPVFIINPDGSMELSEGRSWEEAARWAFHCYGAAMDRQSKMRQEFVAGIEIVLEGIRDRTSSLRDTGG